MLNTIFLISLTISLVNCEVGKPCRNGAGECAPYYLCLNGKINTDGTGILDIRGNFNENNSESSESNEIKKTNLTSRSNTQQECEDYFEECCDISNILSSTPRPLITTTPRPFNRKKACGFRNTNGVSVRITGDSNGESQFGEFPWMVAILKLETVDSKTLEIYHCGGSLIHPKVVLTAAHCVDNIKVELLKVRAGEWDTQTINEPFKHQDIKVKESIIHSDFYDGGLHNNIALLILEKEIEDQPHIGAVCLPPQNQAFDGSRCFASGWGKDNFGKGGKYQVILKKVELPIVSHEVCQDKFRRTRLGKDFILHKSFICAGGEDGKDTCKGDGGSPLVCPIPGQAKQYYQAGIVSWGIGCGENGVPGAYTNVPLFRKWIDEQMEAKGLQI